MRIRVLIAAVVAILAASAISGIITGPEIFVNLIVGATASARHVFLFVAIPVCAVIFVLMMLATRPKSPEL
jgi:hypothetical protein